MIHETIFENIDKVVEYLSNQSWPISKIYYGNAPFTYSGRYPFSDSGDTRSLWV
ncbi:MAG: hypothetical protein BWY95_01761 [Bacteroidetes bacterium ADurb.BinA104]|nr:MAG: hypothetical protein BWY95_01761 [Bacteroidetes bacterium ADurb.BinA104]